jgi:hypothetical protein
MPKLPLGTEGLARPAADLMPQSHRSLNTQPGEVRLDKEGAPTSPGSERPQPHGNGDQVPQRSSCRHSLSGGGVGRVTGRATRPAIHPAPARWPA